MKPSCISVRADYPGFKLDVDIQWDDPVLCLFGPSGSGKSTVLEAVAGIRPEAFGHIRLEGRDVCNPSDSVPANERRVGWVPQGAFLFPHLNVRQNIFFGRHGKPEDRLIKDVMDVLQLTPLVERSVEGLSGGERQRVAMARALASGARTLLLDEPLTGLDGPLRARIVGLLMRLRDDVGIPMIYVSHDPLEVAALAGHVAVIENGRIVAQGTHDEVFASASVLSVMASLGAENLFEVATVVPEGSLSCVTTRGGCRVMMPQADADGEGETRIAVRADDILLSTEAITTTSARNCFSGTVQDIVAVDRGSYVRIRVGNEVWVARLTDDAIADLKVRAGMEVWLLLKASAIHWAAEG